MEDTIKQALIAKVGLTEEQAAKAVEVVMGIVGGKGADVGELAKNLPGGLGDMAGGLLGKK